MNQKQRDLLSKMLQDRAKVLEREIDKQFPVKSCYDVKNLWENDIHFYGKLTKSLVRTCEALTSKQKKLDGEQEQLDSKWNEFENVLKLHSKQLLMSRRAGAAKLSRSVENAIVEIQFAENADQAKATLDSLPSLKDLIS